MVPGVGHVLALGHGQLHVHGCHGNGALSDPACEPGDQPEPPAGMEVEEAARCLPFTGLLSSSDELSVRGSWAESERGDNG